MVLCWKALIQALGGCRWQTAIEVVRHNLCKSMEFDLLMIELSAQHGQIEVPYSSNERSNIHIIDALFAFGPVDCID